MEANSNLLEVYKTEAAKYNKTRGIHWQLNLAIWTMLVLAIYGKAKGEIPSMVCAYEIVLGVIFFILHGIFVFSIHGSLKRSLNRMHDMASHLLTPIGWDKIGKRKRSGLFDNDFWRDNWELFQLGVTVFLIIIYIVVKHK